MKKALLSLLILFPIALFAQKEGSFKDDYTGVMSFTVGKINQLAEAIPEDKYGWAPTEGVRSVSGVIGHITSANYWLASKLGATMPEGEMPDDLPKEEAIAAMNTSYDFLMNAAQDVKKDQMQEQVDFFDGQMYSKRAIMLVALSHVSEHLGQMIAYARSNDIAPPWSQSGE